MSINLEFIPFTCLMILTFLKTLSENLLSLEKASSKFHHSSNLSKTERPSMAFSLVSQHENKLSQSYTLIS